MDPTPDRPGPRWPLIAFLLLCLAGAAVAADLTVIHVRVHLDPRYSSFCAISKEVNCDTVAQSEYSVFLGLPVSVWGLCGNLLMAGLAAWGLTRRRLGRTWPKGLLVLLSAFSVGVSIALAVISKLYIHSMCVMCLASWLISGALLVMAILWERRVSPWAAVREDLLALLSRRRLALALAAAGAAALAALWLAWPRYWELDGPAGPGQLASGFDPLGHPWVGAADPKLTIVEHSDYQCPYCASAHRALRAQLTRFPGLRLVHRNYPLDPSCNPAVRRPLHPAACHRAAAAICAGDQGKFWEMSDLLFLGRRRKDLDVVALAGRIGLDRAAFRACLESEKTRERLKKEVVLGFAGGVRSTPTYQVGKATFAGMVPADRLVAAACAGEQGKHTEGAEAAFERLDKPLSLDEMARKASLDVNALRRCVEQASQPPR